MIVVSANSAEGTGKKVKLSADEMIQSIEDPLKLLEQIHEFSKVAGYKIHIQKSPYFAVHNVHFFAQLFEVKIRMWLIHGYNDNLLWA